MELKRLRGGDPTVIAQQEHDALGPVVREHDADEHGLEDGEDDDRDLVLNDEHGDGDHEESPNDGLPIGDGVAASTPLSDRDTGFPNVSQETAELDMRTVLEEELVEDGLEEGPSIPGETPGQERLSFE
jgi:hypothetical protein